MVGPCPSLNGWTSTIFESSEIVIFVAMDSIDYLDRKVIKGLLDTGFPLHRILFVRNQFDTALDPKLHELGLQDTPNSKAADNVREKLKYRFETDFKENIAKIPGVDASRLTLHFTSTVDVCENDGIHLLMKDINERLSSHEKFLWKEFISRRIEFSEEIYRSVSSWFIEKVKTAGDVTFHSLLNEINSIYKQAPVDSAKAREHLTEFRDTFKVNPEQENSRYSRK